MTAAASDALAICNIAVILSVATSIAVIVVTITAIGATWWLLFDTAAVRMSFFFYDHVYRTTQYPKGINMLANMSHSPQITVVEATPGA